MPSWFPHSLAEAVVFTPLRILFLIIVLVLIRLVLQGAINRIVHRAAADRPGRFNLAERITRASPRARERRRQRLEALGSLAKSVTTVVLMIIGAVMVLAELGFNVTTLVAGTSLIGVSLAFGLQNVIKDLVSGVFMLMEDQLGVGDVVEMQQPGISNGGTVEAIGLRVTQVRLDDGTVGYIRNGEVTRVFNYSQGGPGRLPGDEDEPAPEPAKPEPEKPDDEQPASDQPGVEKAAPDKPAGRRAP